MARTKSSSHSNIIRPRSGLIYGEYLTLVLDVILLFYDLLIGCSRKMTRSYSKCPPGVFCLSSDTVFLVGIILSVIVFVNVYRPPSHDSVQVMSSPTPVVVAPSYPGSGDDRFTRAPKPERNWVATPDLSAVWNSGATLPAIPTRGIPETYQSMGTIRTEDGKILPLYGRRTASRSDRFQYYTRTDTYNPVQIPIEYRRRNCQDDVGCEELYDRDQVQLGPLQTTGEVNVYRFSGPTYIPLV
jgi:hypothetical protein